MQARTPMFSTLLFGAAVLAGCADGDLTAPDAPSDQRGSPWTTQTTDVTMQQIEVCETIKFDDLGLEHGDPVTSVGVFGITLGVSVTPGGANSTNEAVIFDTNTTTGDDSDLQWDGDRDCLLCEGQNDILVIRDARDPFSFHGDAGTGGIISFTGFDASSDEFYVRSFKAFDQEEEPTETSIRILIDDTDRGGSIGMGDGSVETVEVTNAASYTISSEIAFDLSGSGAIDDIVVCRTEEQPGDAGGQGCTPGYWKQPHHFDSWKLTGYIPEGGDATKFCDVFSCGTDDGLRKPERTLRPDAARGAPAAGRRDQRARAACRSGTPQHRTPGSRLHDGGERHCRG